MVAQENPLKNLPQSAQDEIRDILESMTNQELARFLFELGYRPSPA